MGLLSSMRDPRSPAWAVRTAFEPRRRPASAVAAGGWFRSDWTVVDGGRIHARSATGPSGVRPAVLVPGIEGRSSMNREQLQRAIAGKKS